MLRSSATSAAPARTSAQSVHRSARVPDLRATSRIVPPRDAPGRRARSPFPRRFVHHPPTSKCTRGPRHRHALRWHPDLPHSRSSPSQEALCPDSLRPPRAIPSSASARPFPRDPRSIWAASSAPPTSRSEFCPRPPPRYTPRWFGHSSEKSCPPTQGLPPASFLAKRHPSSRKLSFAAFHYFISCCLTRLPALSRHAECDY